MSSILNEMMAEKLDQVVLLLQTQTAQTVPEEKWAALQRELEVIRQAILSQQLQAKSNAQKSDLQTAIAGFEHALNGINTKTTIQHTHHLHKGIWISIGLGLITLLISWKCIIQIRISNQFQENDLKYRYIKNFAPLSMRRFCHRTDSLYFAGKEDFEIRVLTAEKRLLNLADSLRFAGERKRGKKH